MGRNITTTGRNLLSNEDLNLRLYLTPFQLTIWILIYNRIKFDLMNILKNITLYIKYLFHAILLLSFSQGQSAEYIILTNPGLTEAGDSLAQLHSDLVDEKFQLNTEIIVVEDLDAYAIRALILEKIAIYDDLEYLLLLGDETILPPIYKDDNPSDDFYSTVDESSGIPQLATGRIPVKNLPDALLVTKKIIEYSLNPYPGLWRSKVALISDDQHKSGSYKKTELDHTENSDKLFDILKNILNPLIYYGTLYSAENGANGLIQPELTMNILDIINDGVGLINYIGHGSTTTLSDEEIIDMDRDLNKICPPNSNCYSDKKLPIWIVGTCSFGQYDGFDTMSEALIKHEAGAIGLITSTRSIGANTNFDYLERLFGEIGMFVSENSIVYESAHYRLGDLVKKSKNGLGTEYLFHLFGDPALPLPFPKSSSILINPDDIPNNFTVLSKESIDLNSEHESSIIVSSSPQKKKIFFEQDSLLISIPGNIIHQGNSTSQEVCFRIPQDVPTCDTCSVDMRLYSHQEGAQSGQIQFINDIPLLENETIIQDFLGPQISLLFLGTNIHNGITLPPDASLTMLINDPLGLNLMNGFQHNIRFWFDHSYTSYSVDPHLFIYEESCSNGSTTISLPHNLPIGQNILYIEAWDSANNRSEFQITINIQKINLFQAYQVYAIPNPFSETTHFTFWLSSDQSSDVTIEIFNPNGQRIKKLQKNCITGFNTMEWDGRNESDENIANGPYIYHLKAKSDGNLFEKLFKVAKLK